MSAYGPLAAWYDALTRDVDYAAFADFYESCFRAHGGQMHTLLDFCCGTGTLTSLLAARGYEMIASDGSADMLMQAQAKAAELPSGSVPPLLLCQEASRLDLYGTVDAAVCSLDGMNYLPPEELPEVLHRLHLFIRPDGLLIFDIRAPESFRARWTAACSSMRQTMYSVSGGRNSTRRSRRCATVWTCSSGRGGSGRANRRSMWNTPTRRRS